MTRFAVALAGCLLATATPAESADKGDLAGHVAREASIGVEQARYAVDAMLLGIAAALERGEGVSLDGFGAFDVRERASRVAKKPLTGEKITTPPIKVPYFKTGSELRKALNNPGTQGRVRGSDAAGGMQGSQAGNMSMRDLIAHVESRTDLDVEQAKQAVDAMLQGIAAALAKNERVSLEGFGAFSVREKPRLLSDNELPRRKALVFRADTKLKEKINAD